MKIKNPLFYMLIMISILGFNNLNAQLVKDVSFTDDAANFSMIVPNSYLLEIAGPDNYYFKTEIAYTNSITISNLKSSGQKFADGSYMFQITPIIQLTEDERQELRSLLQEDDAKKIADFRLAHNLPDKVDVHNIYFTILNGKFVKTQKKEGNSVKVPSKSSIWQQDHPAQYASINIIDVVQNNYTTQTPSFLATDNTLLNEDDQVFFDDVIVVGSICVGQDCSNGENFGFDTGRYKENNLRVHFDDTSSSSSFPKNDWRIVINDTTNGGASYFAIEDVTASRIPFRIIAGAPSNSLYVDAQGDVGIGTGTPVLELHITDGDSPTMRLEQDGSAGFGAQTWDVAGNETNFFIRDVTNGSQLPFKIKPGADHNALFIDADNDIGLGTQSPSERLQVESGNLWLKNGNIGINKAPSSFALDVLGNTQLTGNIGINTAPASYALDVLGNAQFAGNTIYKGDVSYFLTTGTTFLSSSFISVLRVDGENNRVGIGTAAPGHQLELTEDDAVKPNGGSWSAPSDRRLKENIREFSEGLSTIMKINPVKYKYNGKLGYPTNQDFIGVIAQDMQEIAPYMIKELNKNREGKNYLAFDPSALSYLLINAVQEQQETIKSHENEIKKLKDQLSELDQIKKQVADLSRMISALSVNENSRSIENTIAEKE